MNFLLFLIILVVVEIILSERACVWVCLMIFSVVGVLEQMRAWFTFLGLKSRRVNFIIGFITPSKVVMMFRFV